MPINTKMSNTSVIQSMMYGHSTPTRVAIRKQKQKVNWALMKTWKNYISFMLQWDINMHSCYARKQPSWALRSRFHELPDRTDSSNSVSFPRRATAALASRNQNTTNSTSRGRRNSSVHGSTLICEQGMLLCALRTDRTFV